MRSPRDSEGAGLAVCLPTPSPAVALVRSRRNGIVLMVVSSGLLALGDAGSKWLSATYPIGQIIFLRGIIIVALLVAICSPHSLADLVPRKLAGQLRRAALFVASTFLMVLSLKLLPLPTVSAISFAAPIIMTALAPVMLGEIVGARRWASVLAGFCGVLLIVGPFGGSWNWALLIPLAAAAAAALRDITTRQVIETETTQSVVFMTIGATVVVGAFTVLFDWVTPSAGDCGLFLFLGLAHGSAYLMQVAAFRAAETAFLAPFKYSLLLWSIAIAFAVWGHVPDFAVLAGAGVIVFSGVMIWYSEVARPTGNA